MKNSSVRSASWKQLVLASVSLLLATEASSRLALSSDVLLSRLPDTDTSFRLRWANRHRSTPSIDHGYERFDPLLGWFPKPNLRSYPMPLGGHVSTNSRGMRSRDEFPYERRAGRSRVVLLGDSFTFGEDVEDEEAWASLLAARLPNSEILNLGVSGYGLDQILLLFEREGRRYHPDIVVLGFFWDDVRRTRFSFFSYAKPRFALEDGGVTLTNYPVPTPTEVWRRHILGSRSLDLFSISRETWRDRGAVGWQRDTARSTILLRRLADESREIGAEPVFLYLTNDKAEMNSSETTPVPGERALADYARAADARFASSLDEFRMRASRGGRFELGPGGHWDANGHAAVAAFAAAYLLREELLAKR